MSLHHSAKLLQRTNDDTLRVRRAKHLPDMVMDDNSLLDCSIIELQQIFTKQDIIVIMIADYQNFCSNLAYSSDEIVRTIANFMVAASDYSLNADSTNAGDYIAVECLLNTWISIWKAGGKTNYTELSITHMEIMYNEMIPCDLEGIRLNRFIQLKENHGKVAIDESCEILNDHLKRMSKSIDIESLVNKSLFVSLAQRCSRNIRPETFGRKPHNERYGYNVRPVRKHELLVIEKLFNHITHFTNLSRTIYDNWLWESYNNAKVVTINVESTKANEHQSMVASMFNVLSTSPSSELPSNECKNEIGTSNTSDIPGNVDASKFEENTVTDDIDGTLEDNTNTDGIETDNISNDIAPVDVESEIPNQNQDNTDDYTDDLKIVIQFKKYKINLMCIENLKEIGWTKLGKNLEEERRWKNSTELRERDLIKAAVTYYITNPTKKKRHRSTMVSKIRKKMN